VVTDGGKRLRSVFLPLIGADRRAAIERAQWTLRNNVVSRVLHIWPRAAADAGLQPELRHYLRQCAYAIECEMRQRPEQRQLGSAYSDLTHAIELRAELQRRIEQFVSESDTLDAASMRRRKRLLSLYRKLVELARCNDGAVRIDDVAEAAAFFLRSLAMFRSLQAMVALPASDAEPIVCAPRCWTRLPTHCAVPRERLAIVMRAVRTLGQRHYDALDAEQYLELVGAAYDFGELPPPPPQPQPQDLR